MTQALPSIFRERQAQSLSCWLLMWAFFISLCPLVDQGFSKKLKFYCPPPPADFPLLLCSAWVRLIKRPTNTFYSVPTWVKHGEKFPGHLSKLCKVTMRRGLNWLGIWGKWICMCLNMLATKFIILHHCLLPAQRTIHMLQNVHCFLPSWVQNRFRSHV